MEVMGMQDDIDVMQRYYGEQAWLKCRSRYEHGPSQEWQELYRDVKEALGEDPGSAAVQALAKRWMNLAERDSDGDLEVQAGAIKAWADRKNWPAGLRQRISEYDLESLAPFIASAIAAYRRKYFDEQAWAKLSAQTGEERERLSGEWHTLWLEVRAALGDEPASDRAQRLAARWMELSTRSSGGDSQVRDGFIRAWSDRRNWPEWVQHHYASFQLEQLAEFIAKANAHRRRRQR
jgi:hypothetical protein